MVVADIDRRNVNVEEEEYDMFAEEDTGGQTLQGPRSSQPGPSTSRYRGVSNDYSQPCIKVTQPVLTNQSLAYTSSISRPHDKIWPRQIIPTEVENEIVVADNDEDVKININKSQEGNMEIVSEDIAVENVSETAVIPDITEDNPDDDDIASDREKIVSETAVIPEDDQDDDDIARDKEDIVSETAVIPEDDIARDEEELVSETAVIPEDNIARDEEEYPLPVINMATTEEVPGISTGGTVEAVEDTMGAEETEDNGGQTPRGPRSPQPVNVSREGDVQIAGVSDPTPPGHLPTVQFGSTDIRYRENHQNNDPHAIDGRLEQMTRQYTV